MAAYDEIKNRVDNTVYENGNHEITGAGLNSLLKGIIDTLGLGYQYMGIATSSTLPQYNDIKKMYVAIEKGIYANFGLITINSLSILKSSGNTWVVDELNIPFSDEINMLSNLPYESIRRLTREVFNEIKWHDGFYLDSNGNVFEDNNSSITDYVPAIKDDTFIYNGSPLYGNARMVEYSENGTIVNVNIPSSPNIERDTTITVSNPSTKYVRFSTNSISVYYKVLYSTTTLERLCSELLQTSNLHTNNFSKLLNNINSNISLSTLSQLSNAYISDNKIISGNDFKVYYLLNNNNNNYPLKFNIQGKCNEYGGCICFAIESNAPSIGKTYWEKPYLYSANETFNETVIVPPGKYLYINDSQFALNTILTEVITESKAVDKTQWYQYQVDKFPIKQYLLRGVALDGSFTTADSYGCYILDVKDGDRLVADIKTSYGTIEISAFKNGVFVKALANEESYDIPLHFDSILNIDNEEYNQVYLTFLQYLTNPISFTKYIKLDPNLYAKSLSDIKGDVLYGKKYVAVGDSFTEGTFTNNTVEGYTGKESPKLWDENLKCWTTYPWHIAKRNDMNLVIDAISGSRMTITTGTQEDTAFSNTRYLNIPEDADYLTIMFGLNEINVTIGDENSTDKHTLWGAWNTVLSWIITNRPYLKIGIIISDAWLKGTPVRDAMIAIAKYWGIPYLDLQGDVRVPMGIMGRTSDITVNPAVVSLRDAAFQQSAEDQHPNPTAHKYRSTIVENFLRSL